MNLVETDYLKDLNQGYSAYKNHLLEKYNCISLNTFPAYHQAVIRVCEYTQEKADLVPIPGKGEASSETLIFLFYLFIINSVYD